ncbi:MULTISPECIES: hypothetical protein [unclassified Flavobacterium]|uniref:hypothetical protein n=1 Tax=unclassified Flavobacterium TaxID=196869 RepID=UPI000B0B7A77|nr:MULTISPECIES: hypothetical protein [unclassified Flavobacterium]
MEKQGQISLFAGIFLVISGSVLVSFKYNFLGTASFILAIIVLFYSVIQLNKNKKS